jgi:hypothetical protein
MNQTECLESLIALDPGRTWIVTDKRGYCPHLWTDPPTRWSEVQASFQPGRDGEPCTLVNGHSFEALVENARAALPLPEPANSH